MTANAPRAMRAFESGGVIGGAERLITKNNSWAIMNEGSPSDRV